MKEQGLGIREQGLGLRLVRKPVAAVEAEVVREGSTGRVVLPRVWAVAERQGIGIREQGLGNRGLALVASERAPKNIPPGLKPQLLSACYGAAEAAPAVLQDSPAALQNSPELLPDSRPELLPEMAFYRKYTEALLRRYMRMSMSAGRVPSLMGREMFRGQVSSCRVTSFEDVVIFCYDVEKCLKVLDGQERELIKRIALQSYSQGEAAGLLGISLRSCVRLYADALDKLTQVLLNSRLLKPLESCQ
jgi:hypothetical protein